MVQGKAEGGVNLCRVSKIKQNKNAAKGIAVYYIIAIILGVIVIGVIGYWFFTVASRGGGTQATIDCDALKVAFCQEWSSSGYSRPVVFNEWENKQCPGKPVTIQGVIDFCQRLLGQS